MSQYDGSIRIGTGIETKGFQAGSKELESEVRSMAKSISDTLGDAAKVALQKQVDAFAKANQQYARQTEKIKALGEKLHELQRTKIETAEFKELTKELDRAKASLERLYERRDSYAALGKETPQKLDIDISDAERKVKLLEADIRDLKLTDRAYVPVDTSGIKKEIEAAEIRQSQMYSALQNAVDAIAVKTEQGVQKESERLEKIQAEAAEEERLEQIRVNAVASNDDIIAKIERRKQLLSEIADLEAVDKTWGYQQYDDAQAELAGLNQEIKNYGNNITGVNGQGEELDNVTGRFAQMRQAAAKALNAIASGFSNVGSVAKKAFSGIAGMVKKAFAAITGGAKKGNVSMSGAIKAMLKYGLGIRSFYILVNKFRSAVKEGFANLAQASAPVNASLSALKSSLTQLKNSLATAFAPILTAVTPMLTSLINMLSQAATYVGMFMAALTGASSFTKAVAVQEDYAASLDKTAGSAKKAAGALAAFDDINVLQKKEEGGGAGAEITPPSEMFEEIAIPDRVEDMADSFKEMWENADFTELGADIGGWLKNALENIDWESIKEAAAQLGKSLATLLNGFVTVDGLAGSIGKTVGEAINTGIKGMNAFLDNTDWAAIGAFIGEGVNSLVDTIDWAAIGHFFAQNFNAIFETVGNFAVTFDWTAFGQSIAESINTFISDFNWAENGAHLGELVKGLLDSLVTLLKETNWQKLGEGVADFIGGVDWSGIFRRLSEGIGAALGGLAAFLWGLIKDAWDSVVEWWYDVAFEDGKFTIEGLLEGIWEVMKNIGTWIWDNIFKPFIDGFKEAFGIASPSKVMEEMGGYIMEGLLNGITSLVDMVTETWGSMKETAVEIWENLRENLSGIWDGIKEMFEGVITFLTGVFTGNWKKAWDGVTKIFEGVRDTLKGIINAILGGVETMANGVVSAINTMIRALNNFKVDFPDWVPLAGGKTLGFNLTELSKVSIPRLAAGAVIRGGNPFMAILGDQPRGVTNIETPLPTMVDAFKQAISESGGIGGRDNVPVNINVIYDGEVTARVMIPNILAELGRQGYNVEVLGVT